MWFSIKISCGFLLQKQENHYLFIFRSVRMLIIRTIYLSYLTTSTRSWTELNLCYALTMNFLMLAQILMENLNEVRKGSEALFDSNLTDLCQGYIGLIKIGFELPSFSTLFNTSLLFIQKFTLFLIILPIKWIKPKKFT